MKVHGCASCGARFPTYGGLQEHLLTHRTAGHDLCESCRRTFNTRRKLKRHLRDTSCSQPQPPEPKRQRVSVRAEDPDDLTHPCRVSGCEEDPDVLSEPPPQPVTKVHGCTSCVARFPTYDGLKEHLLTHRTVCHTCNRAFTRRANLLKHKCVIAGVHSCGSCRSTFSTRRKLKRHLRETPCSQPLPPEPKRQRVSVHEEDPDDLIEPPPQQDSDLQYVLTEHWSSIRSHVARGRIQTRYNYRLENNDTRTLDLRQIFQEQTTACKINLSYGFILRHTVSGRYKYYHSSCNCCGRYLDEPSLVTNIETFEAFLESIYEQDILQWAIAQRPNSEWVCSSVTNVTFFVNRILQHPIGCVGVSLPTYLKRNKATVALEKDHHGKPYFDNLCLFFEYTNQPAREFRGVTIDELYKVELVFRVNITVYELGEVSAKLVHRSLGKHADTMFVNLYETHFSYIRDMKKFSHSYTCSKCGESL